MSPAWCLRMYKALVRPMYEYMIYLVKHDRTVADAVENLEGKLFSSLFGHYASTTGRRKRVAKLCRIEPLDARQDYLGLQYMHRIIRARDAQLAKPHCESQQYLLKALLNDLQVARAMPPTQWNCRTSTQFCTPTRDLQRQMPKVLARLGTHHKARPNAGKISRLTPCAETRETTPAPYAGAVALSPLPQVPLQDHRGPWRTS